MGTVTPGKMGLPRTPGKSCKGKEPDLGAQYQRAFDEQWVQRESQMRDYCDRELGSILPTTLCWQHTDGLGCGFVRLKTKGLRTDYGGRSRGKRCLG